MAANSAVQSSLNLQITDTLTPGDPIFYTRNAGPVIFNSKQNSIFDYFIVPGGSGASLVFGPGVSGSVIGTIYVKNVSPATATAAILQFIFPGVTGNVNFPFGPGAVFLYAVPGNTGQVGLPVASLGSISIISTIDVTIEYCISI